MTPVFTTKTRAVDFKFRIGERFDEVTPDKREVRYNKVSFTHPHLLFQYWWGTCLDTTVLPSHINVHASTENSIFMLLSQVCPLSSSIVTVDGNKFIHKSTAKVEGVTGHTVITEFCGDKVTRWVLMILVEKSTIKMDDKCILPPVIPER